MFAPMLVTLGLVAALPTLAAPSAPSSPILQPAVAPVAFVTSGSPLYLCLWSGKQDAKKLAAALAPDQPVEERIAAAQQLASLGKKSLKALPAMIVGLNDSEPQVRTALTEALRTLGKKAREPLTDALKTGAYEGTPIDPAAATKVLMGMGKKAMDAVTEHMDAMAFGPEKIDFFTALGIDGLPFFLGAFGAEEGKFDVSMMRRLRTIGAEETRTPESIEDVAKGVKDEDLALAFQTAWLQTPSKENLDRYGEWLQGTRPMLAETGLWALGLMGSDAAPHAEGIASYLMADDDLVRATAIWALGSLMTPGPGPVVPEIPGSFAGASQGVTDTIAEVTNSDVFVLWSNSGKSVGYRGRIGTKARKLWGLAPTWTSQQLPVPPAPDRSKVPAAALAAEGRLFELASTGNALDSRLASNALGAFGNTEVRVRDMWLQWLRSDDVPRIQSALLGLRHIGRDIIMIEEQDEDLPNEMLVIQQLERPETMVAAAQLLTNIRTPTAWAAVVDRISQIEGKPPLAMLFAISRYDAAALRPYMGQAQDLYEKGHYLFSAILIKFGGEAVSSFEKELSSKLADRRMIAVESLGHIGKDARGVLNRLRSMKDKNVIMQKLINDAIKRIQ